MDTVLGYHETPVRVQFREVDRYGYLWHGHAASYFEIGRADIVRKFDLSVSALLKEKVMAPIIELSCEYKSPAYDDEQLIVQTTLLKSDQPSPYLNFHYHIVKNATNTILLKGKTKQVIVRSDGQIRFRIPATIQERLEGLWEYLAEQKSWMD
jgi:acyl-CoA thioester hydrolase